MDYEELFPGRFVKSTDFKGKDRTLTIASVKAEEIDGKTKAILKFEGAKKEMVLNRTNAEALKLMFGRKVEDWIEKRITFYPTMIKDPFGDGEIGAVRVRGSPDLKEPKSATIQRGKSTIKVSVKPTGNGAAPAANGKAAAPVTPPANGTVAKPLPITHPDAQPPDDQVVGAASDEEEVPL